MIIAECIVECGYGECSHITYCNMVKVVSNPEYWNQYEDCMSAPLHSDFNLPYQNFDKYKLMVDDNGLRNFELYDERANQ